MPGSIILGRMNSDDETDSDSESVPLDDVSEEALREMTSITFECHNRPFEVRLLDGIAFKPFRYLKIRNGTLVGEILDSFKLYETVDYRHIDKNMILDWDFPDRVNDLLRKIDDAPKFYRLKTLAFNYVHRPTDSYEDKQIPELKNIRNHRILYYAKLKDPTGVRPHGNIYCMALIMGKVNNVLFNLEKVRDEVQVDITVMPMGNTSLQLTIVTLFEKIFHRIFGPEHVLDYSVFWEALETHLSLDGYRDAIFIASQKFMKELIIPPVFNYADISPALLFRSFVDAMFAYHQAAARNENPQ